MAAVRRIDTAPTRPPAVWRGALLYVFSLPLIPAFFSALGDGDFVVAFARAAAFGLTLGAATFIRKGIRLQRESERRRIRRRGGIRHYRLIGALMLAVGMFVLAWIGIPGKHGLFESLILGGVVVLGCWLNYGFDPARQDPEIAAVGITTEELVELLEEAEGQIDAIEAAGREIHNREFRDRLRRIVAEARDILDTIERDPVDARRARKFLKVYLDGARQVTEGYARTHRQGGTHELESNFRRVLTTMETVVAEQQEALRENNLNDLDVNIEVLQLQLEKEGVT
ncbi:MAG: 5-bromo-4-chloroindolyl phosphate hydrolase [Gammaproteobacteria bacterium]|nr:MAG: 5-bromo-4-chloroindolyl phosphate hydrolase [Gammaproteobacteria bacterium]PIE36161.1 MAG: 5-bromo-4-chloroindolyl phosphate hydrolase [Gammaproteobacteria bacterium]